MGVEEAEKEDVVKYILKYDPEKQKKKKDWKPWKEIH